MPRPVNDITISEIQALIRMYIEEMHQTVTPRPSFVTDVLRHHAQRVLELLGELP